MSGIDNRIVAMKFDNAQFERGVSTTISSMDKLKQSLHFDEAKTGLQNLSGSIAKFNMGGMEGSIHSVSAAFTTMATVGITALSNITNKAVDAGINLVKSLTISPITEGFSEYELKLGSIQTILANTAKYGTKLPEVTKVLDDLNKYSDKTIYNFGDMTKNIGLFTNAGIKIKDAASMIKGFSNAAAASGTSAEGAAGAAYQLSQALSSGKVTLQDWKSLTNVGMGNKNMQQGIIDIANAMGTFRGKGISAKDAQKNFNATLEKGWLTADVMSKYLKIMAGDMTDAKMKSLGLSKEQIKMFKAQQKTAEEAATKVRTFSQLMGTLREAVGSGWSQTFETIFGNFDEATTLFTNISDAVGGWINKSSEARNKILDDWKKLGGRTHLISAFTNIFEALGRVLGPIKDAFRDIFPPMTGKRLNDLTISFENFTKKLKISDSTMENLKSTFKGIFAVFSILKQLSHGVIKVISGVFSALSGPGGDAGGGFLAVTAKIGDFISGIDEMLKKTKAIDKFFGAIGGSIAAVITVLADFGKAFVHLFTGGDISFFDDLKKQFANLGPIIDDIKSKISDIVGAIKNLLGRFHIPPDLFGITTATDNASESLDGLNTSVKETGHFFDGFMASAKQVAGVIGEAFSWIWEKLKQLTEGFTLQDLLALINTGFFISLFRTVKGFFKQFGGLVEQYGTLIENAGNAFKNFGGALKGMQQNLKAEALLKIAAALLVLVIAIWILSFIDTKDVAKGIGALAVMLGVLNVALKSLSKGMSNRSIGRLTLLSGALVVFAFAMVAMAGAVLAFGKMKPDTLVRGFGSIIAVLVIMAAALVAFDKAGGAKQIAVAAGGLIVMAIALGMLAGVVLLFDRIDTGTMVSGLLKLAATLGILAAFMWLISGLKMPGSLIGLIATAIAVGILADNLKKLGEIDWKTAAKGLAYLAVSLTIIAIALGAMETGIAGAAALLVTVFALKLLIPVIKTLGEMDWKTVAKGLGFLAAAFAVVAIGGWLLLPVIPIIALFAASVALVGAAMFLAGAGMLAFASGLAILTVSGAAGIAVFTAALVTFIELLPLIGEQLGLAIVAWAKVIGEKAPEIVKAIGKLLSALLKEAKKRAPEFYETMIDLIISMIKAITKKLPDFVEAAIQLLEAFVKTFGSRENIKRVYTAAADLLINFLNGLADAINDKSEELGRAGGRIAAAIVKGLINGIKGAASEVGSAAMDLAKGAVGGITHFLHISSPSKVMIEIGRNVAESMALGINKYSDATVQATEDMGGQTVSKMEEMIARISKVVGEDINVEPVIAPVLDLTKFRETAKSMTDYLDTAPALAAISFDQARAIAASKQPMAAQEALIQKAVSEIKFEQNNYSPKALSPSEIYRNTQNQLTLARELISA